MKTQNLVALLASVALVGSFGAPQVQAQDELKCTNANILANLKRSAQDSANSSRYREVLANWVRKIEVVGFRDDNPRTTTAVIVTCRETSEKGAFFVRIYQDKDHILVIEKYYLK
jgi:hypothetical protein